MVLKDNPKAYTIMACALRVHSILGYGFLESAYADALEIEFKKAGIPYAREDNVRIYDINGDRPQKLTEQNPIAVRFITHRNLTTSQIETTSRKQAK